MFLLVSNFNSASTQRKSSARKCTLLWWTEEKVMTNYTMTFQMNPPHPTQKKRFILIQKHLHETRLTETSWFSPKWGTFEYKLCFCQWISCVTLHFNKCNWIVWFIIWFHYFCLTLTVHLKGILNKMCISFSVCLRFPGKSWSNSWMKG